jgi:lipopolysaccharide export system permease protein
MRLLDRYLLRELLVPLGYCLCGFLLFWIASDLFSELEDFQKKKLLLQDIVEYYVVITPEFLVIVLPVALLLALLYALTNHARHHEITAIRAAGISLWRISLPYLGVGFLSSLFLFVVNEYWVPQSSETADRVLRRRLPPEPGTLGRHQVRNLTFSNSAERRVWRIGLYDEITAEMRDPQVVWRKPDESVRWLVAERAIRIGGVWTFYNVREYQESPGASSQPLPSLTTNVLAVPEFGETPEMIRSEIRLSKTISVRQVRKADIPIRDIVDYLRLHPNPPKKDRDWLYTKLHGRMALPWTCIVVVLMAIPFGAASGRRNVFVGVAASITICFAYFIISQFSLAFGTGGYLPPWLAAWLPNILFGTTGLVLTSRVR